MLKLRIIKVYNIDFKSNYIIFINFNLLLKHENSFIFICNVCMFIQVQKVNLHTLMIGPTMIFGVRDLVSLKQTKAMSCVG